MIPLSELRTGQYIELEMTDGTTSTKMVGMISRPGKHRPHIAREFDPPLTDEPGFNPLQDTDTAVAVFSSYGLDWMRFPEGTLVKARDVFSMEEVLPRG